MPYFLVISFGVTFPAASYAATPNVTALLENEITKTLNAHIKCKKITVQIRMSKEKPDEIKILAVKLENVKLEGMTADYATVLYAKQLFISEQLNNFFACRF